MAPRTGPELLRQWWAPEHPSVTDCDIDLRIGGTIHIAMAAGDGMGTYRGTRWPMSGIFTGIDERHRLCYAAQSWTEGERETTTIDQTNTESQNLRATRGSVIFRRAV